MRILDLEPELLIHKTVIADKYHGRRLPDGSTQWGDFPTDSFWPTTSPALADGISFLCPLCFRANKGPRGTHSIHVYFEGRGVPPHLGKNDKGETVRWKATGSTVADITLSPSILLQGGCGWHGWVKVGVTSDA